MTRTLYTNGSILLPEGFSTSASVEVADGRIAGIHSATNAPSNVDVVDLDGDYLVPGFIDVQVNGGNGVLFNDVPTVEGLEKIAHAHLKLGTTGFMPTLISDDLSVIAAGIAAVDKAISAHIPGILGIHIEGPFLNKDKCGIHDPAKFLALDASTIELLSSLQHGRTLVTLAPEICQPEQISDLVERGVIVSLGHSNGTYLEAKRAIAHGASGFTHLFNAMSPLTSRKPGLVGAALESQTTWTSLIVDGLHVSPAVLKLALKLRPESKIILITDSMPNAGVNSDHFYLQGRKILVEDGACRDESGTLAGAALDMGLAVSNAVTMLDISLASAARMASIQPAQFLGLDHEVGDISLGKLANLVRLDANHKIVNVISHGQNIDLSATARLLPV